MRLALLALPFALAGCLSGDGSVDTSAPINKKILLAWQVGEELMIACEQRKERCAEYLAFLERWDEDNLVSFETSLARHKKRVAAGQAM